MTGSLRIAIIKPDWQIRGGFELVVDRLVDHLRESAHRVVILKFDAWSTDHRPFGRRVPDVHWARAPEYFTYLAQVERAGSLQIGRADVVLSTQPPSYVVEHPRHLALLYHHARMFYDLSPYFVAGGMVDPVLHESTTRSVRAIDAAAFDAVKHIAAGSETMAERLALYNGRMTGMSLFHAGPSVDRDVDVDIDIDIDGGGDLRHVLCVSRHDFPKRTELFVHAARLAPELATLSVGTGSRLGMLRTLDARLHEERDVPDDLGLSLWCHTDPWIDPALVPPHDSSLRFAGAVSDADLDRAYRDAICVVAPALLEDYGLTAIEAMRFGKPVIVCRDGGHLSRIVAHGETGLVVEPTGRAIAKAMRFLATNRDEARRMGANAREAAAQYTWTRALAEFDEAMAAVAA